MAKVQGKIVNWDNQKGFGFAKCDALNNDVFVHKTAFLKHSPDPQVNDLIRFTLSKDKDDRPFAKSARFLDARKTARPAPTKSDMRLGSLILPITSLLALLIGWQLERAPVTILIWVLCISLFTFWMYARDKSKAQNNKWRTSERTLLFYGVVGGWPGAIFAQQLLRHKTHKVVFKRYFWLTVVINMTLLGWLHTNQGQFYTGPYLAEFELLAKQLYDNLIPVLISLLDMIFEWFNAVSK